LVRPASPGRAPVASLAEGRIAAGIGVAVAVHPRQIVDAPEVLVVAVPLAGEEGVQGVVEVVAPLGIQAVAPERRRADQPRVVQVALGDDVDPPAEPLAGAVYRRGPLLEERL